MFELLAAMGCLNSKEDDSKKKEHEEALLASSAKQCKSDKTISTPPRSNESHGTYQSPPLVSQSASAVVPPKSEENTQANNSVTKELGEKYQEDEKANEKANDATAHELLLDLSGNLSNDTAGKETETQQGDAPKDDDIVFAEEEEEEEENEVSDSNHEINTNHSPSKQHDDGHDQEEDIEEKRVDREEERGEKEASTPNVSLVSSMAPADLSLHTVETTARSDKEKSMNTSLMSVNTSRAFSFECDQQEGIWRENEGEDEDEDEDEEVRKEVEANLATGDSSSKDKDNTNNDGDDDGHKSDEDDKDPVDGVLCNECRQVQPKGNFSGAQLKKKKTAACKSCVAART